MLIRYHSSVDLNARDHGPRHPRTPSTLGGAPMEAGRGHGHPPQSGYDIVSALQGTNRAPSPSVRSGRRTGLLTTNRIATEDVLGGGPRLLRTLPHREVSVLLLVEVPGPGTDRGRCIVSRRRLMFVILTLRCRCPKLPRRTVPPKARVVGETKVPVPKSRLVPNLRIISRVFLTIRFPKAG